MLIDTHSHLNFNAFKDDSDKVIRRSLDSGVWMINVGSQASTSTRAVKMAEKYEKGVYAAIGLHPIHLFESYQDVEELSFKTRVEEFDAEFYRKLAESRKVVAIGEIGLDYYHLPKEKSEELKKKQKEVLLAQIKLAQELDLPVIFHCRDACPAPSQTHKVESGLREAEGVSERCRNEFGMIDSSGFGSGAYDDLLDLIKTLPKIPRGVLHCFADTYETAQKFLGLGFMVSFTGIVTYPKAESVRETAKKIPLERIMIETDAPYLSPQPVRGERNEPAYVKYVAEEIARIRGLSFDEAAKATTENAIKFFNLK